MLFIKSLLIIPYTSLACFCYNLLMYKVSKIKKVFLIPSVILVILGVTLILLETTNTVHLFHSTSSRQDSKYQSDKKSATVDSGGNPNTLDSKGNPQPNNNDYTPPKSAENISILPSKQGDTVVVSTKLKGYSDGTCNLSVANGARTISQQAQVIYAPDYSTCAGFSIPSAVLGSGVWNISITVDSGGISTNNTTQLRVL